MVRKLNILIVYSFVASAVAWMFNGDGTYYGGIGGNWGPGTCHQIYKPPNYWGVALSYKQYGDGWICGACITGCIYYKGGTAKCFKGIIDNRCATCNTNDLDFGVDGDGKYTIGWSFIQCPGRDPIFSSGENSSRYWGDVRVEGAGPQNYVFVNDKLATRVNGGWSIKDSSGFLGCGPKVKVGLADGRVITKCMDPKYFGGYCPTNGKRCYTRRLESNELGSDELVVLETDDEHREFEKLYSYYINENVESL